MKAIKGLKELKELKEYKGKTIPELTKLATKYFNKFIRDRDADNGCISCGGSVNHAGHFYSSGHYPALRFDESNVHGQCLRCNMFLHGNLNEYRRNIVNRIGSDILASLDTKADYYKNHSYKFSRDILIGIINKYKRT